METTPAKSAAYRLYQELAKYKLNILFEPFGDAKEQTLIVIAQVDALTAQLIPLIKGITRNAK